MSERPWLKWYPADWRADPRLRTCSLASRGLWVEMICLMHEADPYGSLLVNGAPVSEKQLASLVGASARDVRNCLQELEAAGVFSIENEIVFSRRMRRDHERAQRDKANGKGGGNPRLKAGVNPPDNGEDKAQRLEARGQSSEPRGSGEPPPTDPKTDLFRRARAVLGPKSGGSLTAKLLKSIGNEDDPRTIAKARARIEEASTKSQPAEWIGRVMNGPARATTAEGLPFPEGII